MAESGLFLLKRTILQKTFSSKTVWGLLLIGLGYKISATGSFVESLVSIAQHYIGIYIYTPHQLLLTIIKMSGWEMNKQSPPTTGSFWRWDIEGHWIGSSGLDLALAPTSFSVSSKSWPGLWSTIVYSQKV